ncbi:MAG TPA: multicopper oxidase domain-containing protein, partial [Anaeromyxobacter sp.]
VDGSDSRCWQIGFSTTQPVPGVNPKNNVPLWIIANDQGYLPKPVLAARNDIVMCPGERYELLVNFGALPTNPNPNGPGRIAATNVWMTNRAAAPFPAGITPQALGSPFADLDTIMRFDLVPTAVAVKTCVGSAAATPFAGFTWPLAAPAPGAPPPAACIPNPAFVPADPIFLAQEAALRPPAGTTGLALQNWVPPGAVVRMVYLNERLDGLTGFPLGMQLNGVPFEYKVTETPKKGSVEVWKFINLTVDAHPMHPHLVKNLIVSRQTFSVPAYKKALCGSSTCQPGTAPGGEMFLVPDVTQLLTNPTLVPAALTAVTSASEDGAFKDAVIARPGQVTTIVARWDGGWLPIATGAALPTAPGTAGAAPCTPNPAAGTVCGSAAGFSYEPVTSGPYVWHCHINSHEDSEMMRTSLVVP